MGGDQAPSGPELFRAFKVVNIDRTRLGTVVATNFDCVISGIQSYRDWGGIGIRFPIAGAVVSECAALSAIHIDTSDARCRIPIAAPQFQLIGTATGGGTSHLAIGPHVVEPAHGGTARGAAA